LGFDDACVRGKLEIRFWLQQIAWERNGSETCIGQADG
jgi:hypothetical protein